MRCSRAGLLRIQHDSVAQTIATDIATVNKATEEVSAQSDRVSARAAQMSALADDLKAMVSRFRM